VELHEHNSVFLVDWGVSGKYCLFRQESEVNRKLYLDEYTVPDKFRNGLKSRFLLFGYSIQNVFSSLMASALYNRHSSQPSLSLEPVTVSCNR